MDSTLSIKARSLLIAVPVIVALGLGGLYFWKSKQPPSFASGDTIVIADFENTTGDAVFDDGLRQAVSVQLQQTPFVTLLSDQRVQRNLQSMSRRPDDPLTADAAREICKSSGAKASVEGSIAASGTGYAITLGAYDCQLGTSIATEQVQAASKGDVLTRVGAAVGELRKDLGEPFESIEKYNVPLRLSATNSLEALKAYAQAMKARLARGDSASVTFFEQAIQFDPDFALAYARLGAVSATLGRSEDARTNTLKAYALKERVSEYERHYITWSHAQRVTQNPEEARATLEVMTASYPRDFTARNNLGVALIGQGRFEDALKQYTMAREIAPDEPQPISNSAYALLFLARFDEAFAMIERALAVRPEPNLAITRWVVARVQGHPRAAEFESAARTLTSAAQLLTAESNVAVWEGRLRDYQKIVEQLRAQARETDDAGALQRLEFAETITMAIMQRGPWLPRLKALAKEPLSPQELAQAAAALAITGDLDTVRSLAAQLDKGDLNDIQQAQPLLVARVFLAGSKGQVKEAAEMVDSYLVRHARALELHYYLGTVREQNGLIEDAIASYRKTAGAVSILGPNPAVIGAKVSLALLLKKKGDTAGATAAFDELLKQWANADTDFEPLRTVLKNR